MIPYPLSIRVHNNLLFICRTWIKQVCFSYRSRKVHEILSPFAVHDTVLALQSSLIAIRAGGLVSCSQIANGPFQYFRVHQTWHFCSVVLGQCDSGEQQVTQ